MPGTVIAFVGAGVFNPVMSGIVLGETRAEHFGLAAGINDAFRQTGIAVGVAALGAFLPAAGPFGTDPAAYVDGLHHALLAAAVIVRRRRRRRPPPPRTGPTPSSPVPAPPERQRTGV
ncbi:hypothetical protein ACU686_15080 [Yinghuangia aomiensis]